ncbi:MAG: MerR family transcriptional regulator [Coriobacteriia bacterium]
MTSRARDYLTIGEVARSLQDRYPDLTVSKIRFLEDEGLISPGRTPGGYRKFTDRDVARLELVLRLQREHFLPLAVIKDRLSQMDAGKITPEALGVESALGSARLPVEDAVTVSLDAMESETGVPPEFVAELASFGLVDIAGPDRALAGPDIELAQAAWALRRFGIEPRHLKMFHQFAEREVGLVQQMTTPATRLRTPEARSRVVKQVEEVSRLLDVVKRVALHKLLAETFEDLA